MKYIFIFFITIASFAQTWTTIPGTYELIYRHKIIKLNDSLTFSDRLNNKLYTHNPVNNTVSYKTMSGQVSGNGIYHYSEMFYSNSRKIKNGSNFKYAKVGSDTLMLHTAYGYVRFDVAMGSHFIKQSTGTQNGIISYAYTNEPYFVDENKVLIGKSKGIHELTYSDSFREILIKDDQDFYIREIIKVGNSFYAFGRQYNSDTTSTDEVFVYQSIGGYEDFNLVKTFDAGMVYSFNYNQDSSKCWFIIESQDTTKQDRGVWVVKSSGDFSKYISSFPDEYMTALSVTGNELLIATTNNVNTDDDKILQYDNKRLAGTFIIPSSVTQIVRNGDYVYIHYHRTTDLFPENTGVSTMPKFTTDISLPIKNYFLPLKTW